jgi:hypothetical protein
MTNLIDVPLHRVAHARSGDKGNRLNIALVCRDQAIYPPLAEQLTAARVAEIFASRKPSSVVRYDLPRLLAFNFVLDDVLEGGVNASLGLDGHGKSLSFLLLAAPVSLEATLLARIESTSFKPAAE